MAFAALAVIMAMLCPSCAISSAIQYGLFNHLNTFEPSVPYHTVLSGETHAYTFDGDLYGANGCLIHGERLFEVKSSAGTGRMVATSGRDLVGAGGLYNAHAFEVYYLDGKDGAEDAKSFALKRLTQNTLHEQAPSICACGLHVAFARAAKYADTYAVWPWSDWNIVTLNLADMSERVYDTMAFKDIGGTCLVDNIGVIFSGDGELWLLSQRSGQFIPLGVEGLAPVASRHGLVAFVDASGGLRRALADADNGFVVADVLDTCQRPLGFSRDGDFIWYLDAESNRHHAEVMQLHLQTRAIERIGSWP